MSAHRLTVWLFGLALLMLVGCGGGEGEGDAATSAAPPDPEKAARAKLPEFNPEAKYNGKGVLEYAAGLTDLNPHVQLEALENIEKFGVDGLPAREQVRAVVDAASDPQVRLAALGVLAEMKAPEAPAILRQKLVDPSFADDSRFYGFLIQGAKEVGVDDATLRADVLKLAKSDPDHAAKLMMLRRLPEAAQQDLTKAVFESEHDEATTRYFLQNLTTLTFLDDAQRIAYIKAKRPIASKMAGALQAVLLQMGGEEAMNVAIELAALNGQGFAQHRYPLMIQFVAQGSVDPAKVMAQMVEETRNVQTQQQIDQHTSYMESLATQVRATAQREEETRITKAVMTQEISSAEAQAARQKYRTEGVDDPRVAATDAAYIDALNTMITDGPTEMHQALAVSRLIGFVQRNRDVDLATLKPAFTVLVDSSAPEIVRGTAGQQLQSSTNHLAQRDAEGLIAMVVEALWSLEDAAAAPFIEGMLVLTGRTGETAAAVINAIAEDADEHLEDWSVNAAANVLLQVGAHGHLAQQQPEAKQRVAIVLGKMLASTAADAGYLQRMLNARSGMIGAYQTVDGLIGYLEPTIFADHEAVMTKLQAAHTAQFLYTAPNEARTDANAKQRWVAFLQRIIDTNDGYYSKSAQIGMQRVPQ